MTSWSHAWPRDVPGIEASSLRGLRWSYSTSPDGGMKLAAVFVEPFPRRTNLPWTYEAAP